mmetsp:Transcript_32098/g.84080  ORF Transcript_32098/g.84080 Transcript_32098/m.84080 type:complete len:296 (+) Transcript_32098:1913-2800(+)
MHEDELLGEASGLVELAETVGREEVASREEAEDGVRGVHVILEPANLLEVVDVEEDGAAGEHRVHRRLEDAGLVLPPSPHVRQEDVEALRGRLRFRQRRPEHDGRAVVGVCQTKLVGGATRAGDGAHAECDDRQQDGRVQADEEGTDRARLDRLDERCARHIESGGGVGEHEQQGKRRVDGLAERVGEGAERDRDDGEEDGDDHPKPELQHGPRRHEQDDACEQQLAEQLDGLEVRALGTIRLGEQLEALTHIGRRVLGAHREQVEGQGHAEAEDGEAQCRESRKRQPCRRAYHL